ncbi:MAG: DnaD domain protein [Defluviitaleaceae bacterium]|nr:DnaD domain protein [Defluviitaleaceae bacterium]
MGLINISKTHSISLTSISNNFIDEYFGKANPAFIIVYLYFHRHFQSGSATLDVGEVADRLNLLESDVVNALKYWESQQLIIFETNNNDYTIDFLPVQNKNSALGSLSTLSAINTLKVVKKPEPRIKTTVSKQETTEIQRSAIIEKRPTYPPEEIEIYQKESSEIKLLFLEAEKSLGKLLSSNDLSMIFSFYDWLRLPVDVIIMLLDYSTRNGHTSMRYIEKVAIDWSEKGIMSVEQANELIQSFNSNYRQILTALGLGGKSPAPAQIKYMDKWIYEYKMPLDVILEACDATVLEASKPTIKYANAIIENWHKIGVKTVEDAKKVIMEHKNGVEQNKASNPAKPNRFANFSQRDWSFEGEELQKLKWKYLEAPND